MEAEEDEDAPADNGPVVSIDEDIPQNPVVRQKGCSESESVGCRNCEGYIENAERAWAMIVNFAQKLNQLKTLQTEKEQLERINVEQQTYLASQRSKFQATQDALRQLELKNTELEDRLACCRNQYKQILEKANEHQDAANDWRAKYDMSQELIVDLEKKASESHHLYVSSMAVAATFSKKHEESENKNKEMQETMAELLKKINVLEDRVNRLEGKSNMLKEGREEGVVTEEAINTSVKISRMIEVEDTNLKRSAIIEVGEKNAKRSKIAEVEEENVKRSCFVEIGEELMSSPPRVTIPPPPRPLAKAPARKNKKLRDVLTDGEKNVKRSCFVENGEQRMSSPSRETMPPPSRPLPKVPVKMTQKRREVLTACFFQEMRLLPLLEMYEAIDFDAYAAPPRLPCTETLCLDANGMEEEETDLLIVTEDEE